MVRHPHSHLRNLTLDFLWNCVVHPVWTAWKMTSRICFPKINVSRRQQCLTLVLVLTCLIIIGTRVSLQGKTENRLLSTTRIPIRPVVPVNLTLLNWTTCSIIRDMKTGANSIKSVGLRMEKIFHQTYKDTKVPTAYRNQIAKCRNLNPDWKYYLWRDEDIEAFMDDHFPSYKQKYQRFDMNVQRADFIRYMVLYHYGGVYLDMDVECVKPFFPTLENETAFIDQERKEHSQILYNVEYMAMNSAMGSVVGHPFYLRMLESIVNAEDRPGDAGKTTGPDRLTMVYKEWSENSKCMKEYPVTLMEPVMFSPIADTKLHNFNEKCRKPDAKVKKWIEVGCRLLTADWKADATDYRTVGKHLFLHLGYAWGPKSTSFFEITDLGPVKLYKLDHM